MRYRKLGRTDLIVSEIALGGLEIGRDWGIGSDIAKPDEADATRLLHRALDLGINFIDTAPAYQLSEERIGKALKGKRDKLYLATKCGEWFDGKRSVYDYSARETKRFIENSLRQLQTDYLDLLQIHSGSAEVVRRGETLRAMQDAQRDGKVRFLGISCDTTEAALAALDDGGYDTIQVSYNPLQREMEPVLMKAKENNIGVIIKDGLAHGRMTPRYRALPESDTKRIEELQMLAQSEGMTLPELSLRFVLANDAVSTIIAGTKKLEHLEENVVVSDGNTLSTELLLNIIHLT
jgi:aryl-alcohol dehydrogenase-like predicted oxidoreductase